MTSNVKTMATKMLRNGSTILHIETQLNIQVAPPSETIKKETSYTQHSLLVTLVHCTEYYVQKQIFLLDVFVSHTSGILK